MSTTDSNTPPAFRDPLTGAWTDVDPYADDSDDDDLAALEGGDGILFVEVELPDGSCARWARPVEVDGETVIDDDTLDRLTSAIEAILGSPDTLRL